MLKVNQYEYIRTAHRVYGKKIKQIARETGHSKNTIKKMLGGEYIGYKARKRQPYPALGPYLEIIDRWLIEDKKSPKKQRHTAVRVYHRLRQEHGFKGGETTVRKYVREAKARMGINGPGVFIPLAPVMGGEAEVDWGNCIAILGGKRTRLKHFCMRSKYSGKHFVCCYPCERQQALFDGHMQAFAFFGGVFPVLIYDNMTTVVQTVLRGKKRRLQEAYERFRAYYNFEARFCNPAAGHEKGGVEGLVGYSRRNYMVPVPEAEGLAALNERLLQMCLSYGDHTVSSRQQSVNERFEAEKSHLIPPPERPFENIDTVCAKADKFATIRIDKNRYSVPTAYAHFKVNVVMGIDQVDIFYGNKKIAGHHRLYGNNKWALMPEHYLKLIARRPQAFDSARPIRQWREEWPSCLEALLKRFCARQGRTKGIQDFVGVLILYRSHGAEAIERAVSQALTAGVSSLDAIEHLLLRSEAQSDMTFPALDDWPVFDPADISIYDQVGGGV